MVQNKGGHLPTSQTTQADFFIVEENKQQKATTSCANDLSNRTVLLHLTTLLDSTKSLPISILVRCHQNMKTLHITLLF